MSFPDDPPPRWKKCPRYGDLISNIFVPFKVPLSEAYNAQLPNSSIFTPQMFISFMKSKGLNIGLWIDLTNTNRYYESGTVKNEGIEYAKIRLRGYHDCPSDSQVNEFIDICRQFLSQNSHSQIAVHCTHGFNRTGFLICSYLVLVSKWSVDSAFEEFAKARPPGIYKQGYIDELFHRYGSWRSDRHYRAPEKPDWCNEDSRSDEDDDSRCNGYSSRSITSTRAMPSTSAVAATIETLAEETNNPNSNPFEGVYLVRDPHKIDQVQRLCSRMCHYDRSGFPGSHPVSLTCDNIYLLREKDYMVSWKADGTRYMLLIIGSDEMYFLDRDYRVYQLVNVRFLKKNTNEPLTNTLLDGEMVVDVVDRKRFPRYLIYDIICVENNSVIGYSFRERLDFIFKQVFMPRENAKRSGVIDRAKEPIGIRMKDFCELKDTFKYFTTKFTRVLSHEIDGLIFQPVQYPYTPGRCDAILKWKPPSHNSVDFRLKISNEPREDDGESQYIGLLFVGGQPNPFGEIEITRELRHYHNKIIECRFDVDRQCWQFMRERTDKSFPNSRATAIAVWKSMVEPVTQQYLLDFIHNSRHS